MDEMSSSNIPTQVSYLIIGAGVFGASAALALARSRPSESIILVDKDFPPRQSASWDWTKVVRADYPDTLYARLALEAKQCWRNDPLYNKFYHETGIVWVDEAGFGQRAAENFTALGADEKCKQVPVTELRDAYSGLFREAEFAGASEVYVNNSSGWVDAHRAVAAVVDAAVAAGVRVVQAEVSVLTFDENRVCTGVRYADGQVQLAEHNILATGAETAPLLVRSDPAFGALHAGTRLTAAGLVTGVVRLSPEEAARFDTAPVFLQARGPAKGTARRGIWNMNVACGS
jgi:sarcosine oxidase/L-pipecolate oxidase